MTFEHRNREGIINNIKEYYGKIVKTRMDLKTGVCCTADALPLYLQKISREIHPEIQDKFYGCGSPIPGEIEERTILDLGSGSGRDCYILSKLVGPKGHVIGVDATEEQLDIANKHLDYHMNKFGYGKSNIEFVHGYIEDLSNAGISNNSVDVVISNCVINLSPDKESVFSEIFRVLKPGGELFFSDVFAGQRISASLANDPVLRGECLGGALYIEDFRRILARNGCNDYRIVSQQRLTIDNPEIELKLGMIDFYSMNIRAFKLDLEDRCEDYGQVAYYLGTMPEFPHTFHLDDHHIFKAGQPVLVCRNTASMLTGTRYAPHFNVTGDASTHYGLFPCSPKATQASDVSPNSGGCC